MEEDKAPAVAVFRRAKKRTNTQASRKVHHSSEDSDDVEFKSATVADVKLKKRRQNKLTSTTVKVKDGDSSEDDSSDANEEEDELPTSSAHISNVHGRSTTELTEIDTDFKNDAHAQFERVQAELKAGFDPNDKIYRGAAMYDATIKQDSVKGNASSGLVRLGPIRANKYVKRTVRWDYAPDVCKDYKETGFCTFGDSCKFMHDRSDYKHGWEIERDYQEGKLQEDDDDKYLITDSEDENEDESAITCTICGEQYQTPVRASCSHCFCEKCALTHSKKSKKCPVCSKLWTGHFKYAKDVEKRIKEALDKDNDKDAANSDNDSD